MFNDLRHVLHTGAVSKQEKIIDSRATVNELVLSLCMSISLSWPTEDLTTKSNISTHDYTEEPYPFFVKQRILRKKVYDWSACMKRFKSKNYKVESPPTLKTPSLRRS